MREDSEDTTFLDNLDHEQDQHNDGIVQDKIGDLADKVNSKSQTSRVQRVEARVKEEQARSEEGPGGNSERIRQREEEAFDESTIRQVDT